MNTKPVTKKVFFGGSIEPEELISFNEDYRQSVPGIIDFARSNTSKLVDIPVVRIDGKGHVTRKTISGRMLSVNHASFTIVTKSDFYGEYEFPRKLLIRLDNVLGIVPLHPLDSELDPFAISSDDRLRKYFKALDQMKDVMKGCISQEHAATLWYRYNTANQIFREGKYRVECEILEVNNSNVKYKHVRTFAHVPSSVKYDYVDLVPREDFDRFIAPDRYLCGVDVMIGEGVKHPNRLHDDVDDEWPVADKIY